MATDRLLLWCNTSADECRSLCKDVQVIDFSTPSLFTRWLFCQERGAVAPWARLVVGWREAKPCISAIKAAATGNIGGLRVDNLRPALRPPLTSMMPCTSKASACTAVDAVIFLVEPRMKEKAHIFAKAAKKEVPYLKIAVATSPAELWISMAAKSPALQHSTKTDIKAAGIESIGSAPATSPITRQIIAHEQHESLDFIWHKSFDFMLTPTMPSLKATTMLPCADDMSEPDSLNSADMSEFSSVSSASHPDLFPVYISSPFEIMDVLENPLMGIATGLIH